MKMESITDHTAAERVRRMDDQTEVTGQRAPFKSKATQRESRETKGKLNKCAELCKCRQTDNKRKRKHRGRNTPTNNKDEFLRPKEYQKVQIKIFSECS